VVEAKLISTRAQLPYYRKEKISMNSNAAFQNDFTFHCFSSSVPTHCFADVASAVVDALSEPEPYYKTRVIIIISCCNNNAQPSINLSGTLRNPYLNRRSIRFFEARSIYHSSALLHLSSVPFCGCVFWRPPIHIGEINRGSRRAAMRCQLEVHT
jgi:hypothetical protein